MRVLSALACAGAAGAARRRGVGWRAERQVPDRWTDDFGERSTANTRKIPSAIAFSTVGEPVSFFTSGATTWRSRCSTRPSSVQSWCRVATGCPSACVWARQGDRSWHRRVAGLFGRTILPLRASHCAKRTVAGSWHTMWCARGGAREVVRARANLAIDGGGGGAAEDGTVEETSPPPPVRLRLVGARCRARLIGESRAGSRL